VLVVLSQTFSRAVLSPTRVLLLLVFGIAPLFQERLMMWWVLLVPWIVLPLWRDFARSMPAWLHVESTPSFRKTLFCLALAVIALIWTGAGQLVIGNPVEPLKDMVTPVTPVNFMKHQVEGDPAWAKALADYPHQKFTGNMFTPDNLGDYPIWVQAKDAPVLVYSHVQFFPPGHWDDFLTMLKARPGWQELFRRFRVNMVWIEPDKQTELAEAIRANPAEWTVLFDDTRPGEGSPRALFKRFVALRKKPL
jgi:hypothetical protein